MRRHSALFRNEFRTMRLTSILFLLVFLAASILPGCGFQLRGATEIPPELSPFHVQAHRTSRTANALRSALATNGVAMTGSPNEAATVLRILREEEDDRVAAVNSQGKVIGTELRLKVAFDAVDRQNGSLMERQVIELAREYVNPEVEVLGKTEEAGLIRQDMRRDMADRILHRLKAQLLN